LTDVWKIGWPPFSGSTSTGHPTTAIENRVDAVALPDEGAPLLEERAIGTADVDDRIALPDEFSRLPDSHIAQISV
jgi:hypothetical protein